MSDIRICYKNGTYLLDTNYRLAALDFPESPEPPFYIRLSDPLGIVRDSCGGIISRSEWIDHNPDSWRKIKMKRVR